MEPNNKDVRALKLRYKKEAAAANAKDKAMYQRAFQKLAKMPDTEPKAPQAAPEMAEAESKPQPESHPIDSASLHHHTGLLYIILSSGTGSILTCPFLAAPVMP